MSSCRSYAAQPNSNPLYLYYETLANGTRALAPPLLDEVSGLCYYAVNCDSALPCCGADRWVSTGQQNSTNVVNLGSLIVYVAFTLWLQRWIHGVRQRYDGDAEERPPSGIHDGLNLLGVYLGITATVFVSIAMASSTQLALPVSERNSMMAAMAFLTPVKDIFQFLEDTTTVKITLAMGAGDYSSIRPIALLGIVGGLAAGLLGALLMTLLAWWPPGVIQVLLAPGSAEALLQNPQCHLLPTAAEVLETARGLWLLTSWSWPLQFCSMVLAGLLMGAREFALYGLATIAAQGALAGIWFLGGRMDLPLLGWATFLSNLVLCLSLALCLALHVPLRRKLGLMLHGPLNLDDMRESLSPAYRARSSTESLAASKEVLKDGILAMVLDLALQFAGTASVYVAAFVSLQDMYQLSAATAALPQFSAYAVAVGYVVRLAGGALVGRGAYAEFAQLMRVMVLLSAILGIISAAGIYWNKTSLAAYYSVQACEFASSRDCLDIYAGLYAEGLGKYDTTIFTTFDVFGMTAMMMCIFNVVKAGLYACQDFKFMAKASLWVMLVVFLPVLLLARFFFVSATALYLASVLPCWALTAVFLWRLRSLASTWQAENARETSVEVGATM